MFLVFLSLLCFFVQFVFIIGEEHLLAILIITLVLFLVFLLLDAITYSVQSKQIELLKLLAKRQLLKLILISELNVQTTQIELLINESAKLMFWSTDILPTLVTEKCILNLELNLTERTTGIVDTLFSAHGSFLDALKKDFYLDFISSFDEECYNSIDE